jgi:hypothetical protein
VEQTIRVIETDGKMIGIHLNHLGIAFGFLLLSPSGARYNQIYLQLQSAESNFAYLPQRAKMYHTKGNYHAMARVCPKIASGF